MHVKKLTNLIITLLLLGVCFAALPVAANASDATMFRANPERTGVYGNSGNRPNNQELWNFTTGGSVASSPAVANGVVYVGSYDKKVYAFDAASGVAQWAQPFMTGGCVTSSPAVANGVVFIGSDDGKLYAINATTGLAQWAQPFTTSGAAYPWGEMWSSPAVADGVVYFGSYGGDVYAVNATTGLAQWAQPFTTWTAIVSSPAVANGVVYVGCDNDKVYAINAQTGVQIWNFTTGGMVASSPAVVNGVVYVGSWDDGNVYAINATTGLAQWAQPFATGGWVWASPAVANGVVYVGNIVSAGGSAKVFAINATTGLAQWAQPFETGAWIYSSPAVANGIVYVGTAVVSPARGNIYAINATTGLAQWAQPFTTGRDVFSSPAVANGVVYIGSDDNKIYAIGNPKTTLTATAPTTVAINKSFMISGALNGSTTPIAGATIQLQKSVGHNMWSNVPGKTATTTATGAYSISVNEATAATYLYRATYAGNDTYAGSNSNSVTVKVVSKESVQKDLAALRRTTNSQANSQTSQINTATKKALLGVLTAAELQLQYNRYGDAAYTLQSKFLVRTDGCALRGTPDATDLVRTCAAQAQLYPRVQNVVQELQALGGS